MCERFENEPRMPADGPGDAPRGAGAARRFWRNEDGSLIVFSLFIFLLMLVIGGLAVDLMRFETHRAKLQATLDRAVLAAAKLDQPLAPENVVVDYFTRAGLGDYISTSDVTTTSSLASRTVSASTQIDMGTTFMKLLGMNTLIAPAAGTAEESVTKTEVSLIVDVSGSMSWSSASGRSKIYELRNAATEFVNILMCDPSDGTKTTGCVVDPNTVSINLVPYSEQVLAGPDLFGVLNVTNEHNSSTCVNFAASDFADTALDPAALLQRTGHFDPWRGSGYPASSWTCQTDSWRRIMPLENDPADLRARISSLGASGNTSIDVGMKWGAGLLDPAFRPATSQLVTNGVVTPAFSDRPYNWTETSANKVIVLMTDGVNTSQHYLYPQYRSGPSGIYRNSSYPNRWSVSYSSPGWYYWIRSDGGSWSQQGWHDHPYGAGAGEPGSAIEMSFPELWAQKPWRWYTMFSWHSSPGSSYGNSTKNSRLGDICSAAKAQGITIFALGFEVTTASAQVMADCASSASHYFNVDGTTLSEAFAAIARKISPLRLVN